MCIRQISRCVAAASVFFMLAATTSFGDDLPELLLGLAQEDGAARAAALDSLVATGDDRLETILEDYRRGSLYSWNDQIVFGIDLIEDDDFNEFVRIGDVFSHEPLLDAAGKEQTIPIEDILALEPNRAERRRVTLARTLLGLSSPHEVRRRAAVRKVGTQANGTAALETLQHLAETDGDRIVRFAAAESSAMIRFRSQDETVQREAAEALGRLRSVRARSLLEEAVRREDVTAPLRDSIETALARIRGRERLIATYDIVKSGISSGSVLVLMALGLAIIFGMMGVINMAHGEMMMVGSYTTYATQLLFNHTPEHPVNSYYIFALPLAFCASALVAGLIEYLVVRRLYKRPLESLLATYGIGLIMIQTIRSIFGDNRPSNSPSWLQGALEFLPGLTLPYNRLFILMLCFACVLGVSALFRYTSLGLKMRATLQNRDMAAAMGINTRMVDSVTFMTGGGLAGVAGYALTTIGGITPDMGQNYIVDSFLVVVTGGVGNIAGVVCSGFGLGLLNKVLEGTLFGAVWAKIIMLLIVIAFIQYKPSGLFAPKGRLADE